MLNFTVFRERAEEMRNRAAQNHNLAILTATALLSGIHTNAFNVIWQPFVLSFGASMAVLGILNSLGGSFGGLITNTVQPLGGWLSDRLGRKPFILLASLAIIASFALYGAAGWRRLAWLLVPATVLMSLSALARPARSMLTAESVKETRHGHAFSLTVVAATVPGILVPTAAGWFADRFGYPLIFPISLFIEAVVLCLVWRYLRETRERESAPLRWGELGRVLARAVIPPQGLRGFFFAVACDSFAWGMGWGLLYGMLTKTYNYTGEQLGILSTIISLAWAVMQMPIGRYIDRRGTRSMLIFSEALGPPLMLIWITQSQFEILAASMVLFALTAATWVPTTMTYLVKRVPPDESAAAFGQLSAFRGLVGFPAPAIGGFLYDAWGFRAPLIANLIGSALTVVLLWLFVHDKKGAADVQPSA
jgi:MFS family permease